MDEQRLAGDSPATDLFPQYQSQLYEMVSAEVAGLTEQQLDWESDRWEWSKWNIRRQVSHIANLIPGWLLTRWGDQLFPGGFSELGELAEHSPSRTGAWLDENQYWALPSILSKVDQAMRLAQHVLTRETVESIRRKEIPRPDTPPHWRQFEKVHPTGIRWHNTDPNFCYMSLEATFRHMYFETTTHLYNIQRLKRAQGLTATVEIPYEGYWALPDWDRSEP